MDGEDPIFVIGVDITPLGRSRVVNAEVGQIARDRSAKALVSNILKPSLPSNEGNTHHTYISGIVLYN
jgi:hypothetical protein